MTDQDMPEICRRVRAAAPAVSVSDRFWDDLAARTSHAAAAAMTDAKRRPVWRVTGIAAIVVAAIDTAEAGEDSWQ